MDSKKKKKTENEIAFPYSEFLIYENSRHDVQKKTYFNNKINKQTQTTFRNKRKFSFSRKKNVRKYAGKQYIGKWC